MKKLLFLFSFAVFCFGFAAENKICIIEIPLNESQRTVACRYLEDKRKLIDSTKLIYIESHDKEEWPKYPEEADVYCLMPYNGMTRFYGYLQEIFPFGRHCPYVPIVYHIIAYLCAGERTFFNTTQCIDSSFTKESSIKLLYCFHEYSREELNALASNLSQKGFQNLALKAIYKHDHGQIEDHDEKIPSFSFSPDVQAYHNKQWWIDKFWFRWFLRVSRVSTVALFLIPILMRMYKNF